METSRNKSQRPCVGMFSIHSAPYRDPIFAELYLRDNIDLRVITMLDKDPGHSYWRPPSDSYSDVILESISKRYSNWKRFRKIFGLFRTHKFDVVVIPGYYNFYARAALICAALYRIPIIFSVDTVSKTNPATYKQKLVEFSFRRFIQRMAAVWVPGLASATYMQDQGVPSHRIFQGSYNLDISDITSSIEKELDSRSVARRQLGIADDDFVFLMVGNFIPNRLHWNLIQAFSEIQCKHEKTWLLLVGNGPEKDRLQRMIISQNYKHILFPEPVPFEGLARFYALCNAYVHSGEEPYSTALAYGAIAGRPLITSLKVGAAYDYIEDYRTGLLFNTHDLMDISGKMSLVIEDMDLSTKIANSVRELASQRTSEWAAQQLEDAVQCALY